MGGIVKSISKAVGKVGRTVLGGLGMAALDSGGAAAPETPAVDPEAERRKAEQDAAIAANTRAAERSRQRRTSSLLAAGGNAAPAQTTSVLAYGKGRLGE